MRVPVFVTYPPVISLTKSRKALIFSPLLHPIHPFTTTAPKKYFASIRLYYACGSNQPIGFHITTFTHQHHDCCTFSSSSRLRKLGSWYSLLRETREQIVYKLQTCCGQRPPSSVTSDIYYTLTYTSIAQSTAKKLTG